MRIVKKILLWFFLLILAINLFIVVTGNSYMYRALIYQYAGIDDYKHFENRTVKAGTYIPIPDAVAYNKTHLS